MHPLRNSLSRAPLLSTGAVAKWFGVSQRTVCLWAECGEIPAIKVGKQWRFREEELQEWLESAQARVTWARGGLSQVAAGR